VSSTFADSLREALEANDSEAVVHLLEPRVADGTASDNEALLCGALLLMPPLAEYEAAANVFRRLLAGARAFEAAVWDAYRFAVLMPSGDHSFEQVLRSSARSSVAAHMLSWSLLRAATCHSRFSRTGYRARFGCSPSMWCRL
jgi:hypothetical protein